MARLQILELPEGSGDDRPPFVLVVDQYVARRYVMGVGQTEQPIDEFDGVAEKIGARAVLVFEDAIDIPANDTSAYLGGSDVRDTDAELRVERDRYLHFACAARGASGARDFPSLTDTILALRDRAEQAEATIARVRNLHRPVEHRGQTICAECSDYDFPGQTTDSPPVTHDQCGTLRALDGTEHTGQDFTSPIAGRVEVRQPCPYCGDQQMIPRSQFVEHVARLHPDEPQPAPDA